MTQTTVDHIRALNDIPRELRDQIADCLHISPTLQDTVIAITASYKPPVQFSIDRKHRQLAIQNYFTNANFEIEERDVVAWITSLPRGALALINQIRIRHDKHNKLVEQHFRSRDYSEDEEYCEDETRYSLALSCLRQTKRKLYLPLHKTKDWEALKLIDNSLLVTDLHERDGLFWATEAQCEHLYWIEAKKNWAG